MLNRLDHQQIADLMKEAVTAEEKDSVRRPAQYAIQRFEAAGFRRPQFEQAISEQPAGSLTFDEDGHLIASADAIRETLERYIDIVEEGTGQPIIENELFSARQANFYIARQLQKRGVQITSRAIDYHITQKKDLRGQLVGRTMLFTRRQLDEYVANFDKLPKRGRPSKQTTS